jgi:hypothetical protein
MGLILAHVSFLTISTLCLAGPGSAGGPVNMYNDAVCIATDLSYQVHVAKDQTGTNTHLVTIYSSNESGNQIVRRLQAKRVQTEQPGVHATYVGPGGFYFDVRLDQVLSGGGGRPGGFSFSSGSYHVSRRATCPYFPTR